VKFAIALIGVGVCFAILAIPIERYEETGQRATLWRLLTVYLLQTWAELLLSPDGGCPPPPSSLPP
jgi:POT family proton-dependent oligopeptide transporter